MAAQDEFYRSKYTNYISTGLPWWFGDIRHPTSKAVWPVPAISNGLNSLFTSLTHCFSAPTPQVAGP